MTYEEKTDEDFKKPLIHHVIDDKGYVLPDHNGEDETIEEIETHDQEYVFDMKRDTLCNDEFDEFICTTM